MRKATLTQNERVLRWAKAGRVLDQREWFTAGADGGSAITAVRTRVSELEAKGYRFRHVLRRGQLAQYWLVSEPPDVQPQSTGEVAARTSVVAEIEQLALELPPGPSTSAVYDDWDA
jgi:hypothetical protein